VKSKLLLVCFLDKFTEDIHNMSKVQSDWVLIDSNQNCSTSDSSSFFMKQLSNLKLKFFIAPFKSEKSHYETVT
jgi:hypothetical protein